jgi:outer membrane protein assembly factor BamB
MSKIPVVFQSRDREMLRTTSLLGTLLIAIASTPCKAQQVIDPEAKNWHHWRGPLANGVAPRGNPPITWSESENILWKVPIEGYGKSTPIIWDDKVFLLTAIDTNKVDANLPAPEDQPERPFGITYPNTRYQYVVICLERETGRELWRRVAAERIPNEGHHGDNSFASASPTTDGERLYAWFGSAGLFCYDLAGNQLWSRNFGNVETRLSFGEGTSPVVFDGKVVVTRDNDGQSYIVVLDAKTGGTLWRADRDEPSGWSTPVIAVRDGRRQLVTNGKVRVRSYDLDQGSLIWECGGQASNVTPSPVLTADSVLCMSGYRGSALYSIPLSASGDITDTDTINWTRDRSTPYVPSPLLYDGLLYFNRSNDAILTCLNAESGEVVIEPSRMPGIRGLYASPVGAAGRVYFAGRRGTTLVIERGDEFKVVAQNRLDEGTDASPAIAGKQLFLRGRSHLYCIAEKD